MGYARAGRLVRAGPRVRAAVTVEGILEHEVAFQAIADAGTGNRLSGAPGYAGSADYVADVAAAAGLDVSSHEFDYDLDALADYAPPELSIVSGAPAQDFVPGIGEAQFGGDFGSM